MKLIKIFFVVLITFCIKVANSQESTLLLMNGKRITISNYTIDTSEIDGGIIYYYNDNGNKKKKYLDDVFALNSGTPKERFFYNQNIELGNTLTLPQMRMYVKGLNDVLENYKVPNWIMGAGIASGFLGGIVPQANIDMGRSGASLPVGILIPTTYVAVVGVTNPDYVTIEKNLPNDTNNEYYSLGVDDGIQKKRIKNSLIGSAIGFVAGMVTIIAVN